ncbi:alkaline phosphatase-like [Macrosteles quadrilineatus]|uniref:alkaline phosphatase-like n=1 Tax=Macrosteles quadrilineatus TaxID=74068 RepID=UPI0023E261F4|nr:alkaline phosphatase-like [Macrosteles quadrilineatus]
MYIKTIKCWLFLNLCNLVYPASIYQGKAFWYEEAARALRQRLKALPDTSQARPKARGVVLLVGDGLGVTTSTAARIFKGQRQGQQGEESILAWDRLPAVALAKTYNLDAQIGESSACATALMCGVKANFETLGLDAGGLFEDCFSVFNSKIDCLLSWAQKEGMSTGLVTSTRVTHATPAALFAHSPSRYWEDDSKVPPAARKLCKDITRQLVEDEPGKNLNVVMGGGRRHWLPRAARDPETLTEEGRRLDGRNLIDEWIRDKRKKGLKADYVWNKGQMDAVDAASTDHLLGLFSYSHMEFEADRELGPSGDPSLVEMVIKALSILLRNPQGFFLFVESGRIDHAHHYNNPYRALEETLMLDAALLAVLSMIDQSQTLIVVTSDHSHVMTLGGISTPRGNPILGTDSRMSDMDGLPYSTLLYSNGPGYSSPRSVPGNGTGDSQNAVHSSGVPRQWATHGGEDVPVYAQGPMALQLFSGTVDQSYIPHAIAYAACLGPYTARCTGRHLDPDNSSCLPDNGKGTRVLASSVMSDDRNSHHLANCGYSHRYSVLCILAAVVLQT